VSKETISRITDKVIEEMNDWAVRPLDETYAAIFIDAIVVKVRDGQVANRPFYAAIGLSEKSSGFGLPPGRILEGAVMKKETRHARYDLVSSAPASGSRIGYGRPDSVWRTERGSRFDEREQRRLSQQRGPRRRSGHVHRQPQRRRRHAAGSRRQGGTPILLGARLRVVRRRLIGRVR
jgi:hypothetical protein